MFWKRLLEPLKQDAERTGQARRRMQAMRDEYDRLRAELSHLEHEIYEIWESDLPRSRKAILESAIRARTRPIEDRMWDLTLDMLNGRWDLI